MLNTLFGRNWNTAMPNLDNYHSKVILSSGAESFYVQDEVVKAYKKWGSPIRASEEDMIFIFDSVELKGWITFIGNYDAEDNTFVVFTTSSVYYARFDHGNSCNNVALRVGEKLYNGSVEKNFYISKPLASDTVRVFIDACKIKNAYGMIRADYTNDAQGACASLRVRREHVDYDVEMFCKKVDNQARIIENPNMRGKMEMFFLMAPSDNAYNVYQTFVQEIFEEGILPSDIEIMKIKSYHDAQFVSEALFERSMPKVLCFMDHEELWRINSDGSWDYSEGGDVISWKWEEARREYVLVSNFAANSSSEEKTIQTLAYAYVIKKAEAYLKQYFGK